MKKMIENITTTICSIDYFIECFYDTFHSAAGKSATHVYLCGRVCVYVCVSSLCARAPADSCCKVLDNVMRVEYLTL